ncbi:MAG TPA: neutral/alkaline non-lysosomal ceramidase N-terminal domain-containing protein [Clostridia bacterium]|nr:neutral/alkaline non-lysosomal ceramidase N-terminal domain-containing protein [Clostridia bacterium]
MIFAQARELITPTILTTMSGYANRTDNFLGVHDDLYVKVIYMENNGTSLMFITFDLCHYLYDLNDMVMKYASSVFKIPYDNIIVNYSHTHAGPKITSATERDDLSPLHDFFIERAKACIDRAHLNSFEGTLQFARTTGRWNVNRRLSTPEGMVMRPNHDAPTDDEMNLLLVRDMENNIRTVIVNYSCHPVTLSSTLFLSAEFPGRLCQLIEAEYYGSMAFFLQGAAGNLRPLVTADKGRFKACSFRELDAFASSLALEIKRVIHSEPFEIIEPEFKSVKFILKLPIEPLDKSAYGLQLQKFEGYLRRRMETVLANWEKIPDFCNIHCGIARLTDDLYIPYMGGEILYEVKQIVNDVFSPATAIFLGYQEAMTYIPTDKIIDEGGYEGFNAPVFTGFRGPFKKGIDKIIKNMFEENLERL